MKEIQHSYVYLQFLTSHLIFTLAFLQIKPYPGAFEKLALMAEGGALH